MIEGWDSSIPNTYLLYRIAVTNAQVDNASVNDHLGGEGCTELDSHANMCVLGKYCFLLTELSAARKVSVGALRKQLEVLMQFRLWIPC